MKNRRLISLITFLLLATVALAGCDDNHNNRNDAQALTENDFAADPTLSADPERGVVVTFLEPPNSDTPDNDTGEIGTDSIPYKYNRTLEHNFCWDDDAESGHFMELEDSGGNKLFRLDANGECMTVVLDPGDYTLRLYHDGRTETTYPIFMIPGGDSEPEAKKDDSVSRQILAAFYGILNKPDLGFTQTSNAQTVAENIETLVKTRKCLVCDLKGGNFDMGRLEGVDVSGSDMESAFLFKANLTKANLDVVNLEEAFMEDAVFHEAHMNGANMRKANMPGTDFSHAGLMGADMSDAKMILANLEEADLFGVKLDSSDLKLATLHKAHMFSVSAKGADLSSADLSYTILSIASLNDANLESANFEGADLSNAGLNDANLKNANFTDADLSTADLSGVKNLSSATLTGAKLDFTIWCDGTCVCEDKSIGSCKGCNLNVCKDTE